MYCKFTILILSLHNNINMNIKLGVMRMRSCKFKEEKSHDFIKAFEEELKELGDMAPFEDREKIIMKTLYSGKGRYYITFEEAARSVRKVLDHQAIRCKNGCKMAMYEEMALKVADYMQRHPSYDYRAALYRVLAESRASRFFFGMQTAKLILYQHYRSQRRAKRDLAKLRANKQAV